MPAPTSAVRTRPDIAGSLTEFDVMAEAMKHVGARVLKVFEAAESAGNFGRIPLEELLKNVETNRQARGNYNRLDFQFEDDTYSTKEQGLEGVVDENRAKVYRNYFNYEVAVASLVQSRLLENFEKAVAAAVFDTAAWTGSALTTAISTEWSTVATATPITDVEGAVGKVYDGTGLWPNALIINRKVFRNLRRCDQVIDAITASGAGQPAKASDVTAEMLARVFDLDYVIVAGTTKNGAGEGLTPSPAQIWSSEYAMVARIATTDQIEEPCIGRVFHWDGDGSQMQGTVERYHSDEARADVIRVRHQYGLKRLLLAAGHLLSNITA